MANVVRSDGLSIRALDEDQYKAFIQRGKFWQWYGKGTNLDTITLSGHTSYNDQYLLMPINVFKDWESE